MAEKKPTKKKEAPKKEAPKKAAPKKLKWEVYPVGSTGFAARRTDGMHLGPTKYEHQLQALIEQHKD
tara:strand:- start:570 stop:770 length:201 start_codon:yes stop_codon:yes gene_type:complete